MASMRRLLFTTGSPFARAVRVVLAEIGLDYERAEEITTPAPDERARATPTLQVPTFWDGDLRLWESGLIAEYLVATYPGRAPAERPLVGAAWRPQSAWQDRLSFATVQTLGTAVTTISQMTWSGVRHDQAAYLSTAAARLPHLLGWLDAAIGADGGFYPGVLSLQDVFLTCHLGFAANRPLGLDTDWSRWPRVATLVEACEARASFRDNPVRWWEPGVTGYAPDGTPVYGSD